MECREQLPVASLQEKQTWEESGELEMRLPRFAKQRLAMTNQLMANGRCLPASGGADALWSIEYGVWRKPTSKPAIWPTNYRLPTKRLPTDRIKGQIIGQIKANGDEGRPKPETEEKK